MKQKTTLALAAALTAFLLIAGGAVVSRAFAKPDPTALSPDAAELQSAYAQREAEYQARIAEANAALKAAYAQQNGAAGDPAQLEVSTTTAAGLSTQDAIRIAIMNAPNANLKQMPELVNFEGTVAYEVILDLGVMYVDANTGTVLYNGAVQPQLSAQAHDEHDDDDDHGWNDDDHGWDEDDDDQGWDGD